MGTGPKLPSHSSSCLRLGLSRDRKVGQFGICHGYFQHPHLYYTALHTAKWVESEPSCRMRGTPATSGAQPTCRLGTSTGDRGGHWASVQLPGQGRTGGQLCLSSSQSKSRTAVACGHHPTGPMSSVPGGLGVEPFPAGEWV